LIDLRRAFQRVFSYLVYPHFTRSEFLNNQQTALVHHVVNAYTTQVSYSQ